MPVPSLRSTGIIVLYAPTPFQESAQPLNFPLELYATRVHYGFAGGDGPRPQTRKHAMHTDPAQIAQELRTRLAGLGRRPQLQLATSCVHTWMRHARTANAAGDTGIREHACNVLRALADVCEECGLDAVATDALTVAMRWE